MRYAMTLTGITPLLMHFDNIEAQDAESARGKSGGKAGDDRHPSDRWKSYLYVDTARKALCMPSANILAALLKVGSSVSIGGKKTLKAGSQAIAFDDVYLRFLVDGKPVAQADIEEISGAFNVQRELVRALGFEIQVAPCRVNGKRHIRTRPMFATWSVVGDFAADDPDLTTERLETLFRLAGSKSGLGDWRPGSPSKPGPYGRFDATIREIGAKRRG